MTQAGSSPSEFSVAVAGGGIIGMSIAWRLAQQGWQVTVFDKGGLGGEASWAAAGMLSPGGEIEKTSELAALAIESRRLYREFVRELERASGLSIDYQECGALDLAYSEAHWEALEERAAAQSALGIVSKPLAPSQISTFWPRVRAVGVAGARFYPDDAIVNPREVMAALEVCCGRAGVRLRPHCAMSRVEISDAGARVESGEGARTYDVVVLAAGAWSDAIEVRGVEPPPVSEPIKGHLVGYQQPEQTCATIVRHAQNYFLQRANGLLIAGTSVEHAGFNREIQADIVADLAREAGYVFPHLAETTPSEVWIGFRPGSSSLQLGAWCSPRLYLAYGHYRNGILLAPVTAQRLSAAINANWRMR